MPDPQEKKWVNVGTIEPVKETSDWVTVGQISPEQMPEGEFQDDLSAFRKKFKEAQDIASKAKKKVEDVTERSLNHAEKFVAQAEAEAVAKMTPKEKEEYERRKNTDKPPVTDPKKTKSELDVINYELARKQTELRNLSMDFARDLDLDSPFLGIDLKETKERRAERKQLTTEIQSLKKQREEASLKQAGISTAHFEQQIAEREAKIEELENLEAISRITFDRKKRKAFGEEIDAIEAEIGALKGQKAEIVRGTAWNNPEVKKKIESRSGIITGHPEGDYDNIQEFGPDWTNKIESEFLNDRYKEYSNQIVQNVTKQESTPRMIDFDFFLHDDYKKSISNPEKAKEAGKLFTSLKDNPDYVKASWLEKKRVIADAVKDHYKGMEDADQRKKAEMELMPYMLQGVVFDKEGNISLNGVQLYAENLNSILTDRLRDVNGKLNELVEFNETEVKPMSIWEKDKGYYNTGVYKSKLDDERMLLSKALEFNKTILEMNPEDNFARKFEAGLFSNSARSLLTAGINDMINTIGIKDIAEKALRGEQPTFTEERLLEAYSVLNLANSTDEMSGWYTVGAGVSNMIPYITSFALTSGVSATAGKAVTGVAKKAVPKSLSKSLIGQSSFKLSPTAQKILGTTKPTMSTTQMAERFATGVTTATVQTLMNQQMYQKALAERQMPHMELSFGADDADMMVRIDANTVSRKEARGKAYAETFFEFYTERLGTDLMKGLGIAKRAGQQAIGIKGKEGAKKYLLSKYLNIKGLNHPGKKASKIIKKDLGWNGIVEEYMEELANYFMTSTATGEGADSFKEFMQQQLETLGTVAIFGGAMQGAQLRKNFTEIAVGDNKVYKWEDSKGVKHKVKIPNQINEELRIAMQDKEMYGEKVYEVLDKYEDELSKEQVKLITEIVMQKSVQETMDSFAEKAVEEEIVEEEKKKAEPEVVQTEIQFEEGRAEETAEVEIDEEDQVEISEASQRVRETYPDLFELGLLETDQGGQLLEPTVEQMKDKRNEIKAELRSAEKDAQGNIIIQDEITAQLLNQVQVIDQFLEDKRIDTGVPFQSLPPDKKFDVLLRETRTKKLSGELDKAAAGSHMSIRLNDGRIAKVYFTGTEKDRERANKAINSREEVDLKFIPQEEWNPEGKFFYTIGEKRIPYGDKVSVVTKDGTIIGNVEALDYNRLTRLKEQAAEVKQEAENELAAIADIIATKTGVKKDIIDSGTEKGIVNHLIRLAIKIAERVGLNVQIVFEQLKQAIQESTYNQDFKDLNLELIDKHEETIQKAINDHFQKKQKTVDQLKETPVLITTDAQVEAPKEVAEPETEPSKVIGQNILKGYQGTKSNRDNREYNYYTTNINEAKDYGGNITEITIDSSGFLKKYTEDYNSLTKEFNEKKSKETGRIIHFDILDNSKEGLKIQNEFFKFIRNKGYKGYSEIIDKNQDENTYFVTFPETKKVLSKIDIKETEKETLPPKSPNEDKRGLNGISLAETDAPAESGEQKLNKNLKTFGLIWSEVAEIAGVPKAEVEKEFYRMAKSEEFQFVIDETSFKVFLESYRGKNAMVNTLIDVIDTIPFERMLSAFDFYGNVQITKQIGIILRNDGARTIQLNISDQYESFVKRLPKAIENFNVRIEDENNPGEYRYYKGMDGVRDLLLWYNRKLLDDANRWSTYSEERKTEIRTRNYNFDLALLEKITGIDRGLWAQFFNPQNKESIVYLDAAGTKKQVFPSHEATLGFDTYRKKGGVYKRLNTDLVFLLTNKMKGKTLTEAKEELETFFVKGDPRFNVLSNLYKLSTSIQTTDDISLYGTDVKGDRFSSFQQASHLATTITDIRNLKQSSLLKAYYQSENKDAELVLLNGIQDYDRNKGARTGTESGKMSVDDMLFSFLQLFTTEENNYLQHIGQYGDKDMIGLVEVQKFFPEQDEITKLKEKFPDFDQAVTHIKNTVIMPNQKYFGSYVDGKLTGPVKNIEGANLAEKFDNLATAFTYNYAVWMEDINRILHGNISQYDKGIIGMFKRAGSTNSPGYRVNTNIKGGIGKTYKVVVMSDKMITDAGLKIEVFDGFSLMSGDFSDKLAVSMGDAYYKPENHDILDSVKALHSVVNEETGARGLMKTNNVNVEALADQYPNSIFAELKKLMKKHKIDVLTFTSGNKHLENDVPIENLFSDKGKVITSFKDFGKSVFTRNTKDFYIQQDLRHTTQPMTRSMPSQMQSNMITLPNGIQVSKAIYETRQQEYIDFLQSYKGRPMEEIRNEILKLKADPFTNESLIKMIETGVDMTEPSIARLAKNIVSSGLTKALLSIPVNRVTSQEIPDADQILKPLRRSKANPGRMLLPDIASKIDGARAEDTQFEGDIEGAKAHVLKNKALYPDMFDRDGKLMDWEIVDRNGVIPGEFVISTRVPADDLHSHVVARLKINFTIGNFTMVDVNSRVNGGSDFDGDARYNQVIYKTEEGIPVSGDHKFGLSNQMVFDIAYDYMDPVLSERINTPIDTNAYDDIVEKQLAEMKQYSEADFRAFMQSWEQNKTGVEMKGIMTDMNTIFSLAGEYNIKMKEGITLPNGTPLQGFINDNYGAMKSHIANLLNMSFDNAKDPKIEVLGLNEITVNMFMLSLMTDHRLNSSNFDSRTEHYEAIKRRIAELSEYFNSPLVLRFIELARKKKGGLYDSNISGLFDEIKEEKEKKNDRLKYNPKQIDALKQFYYDSSQLYNIRRLFKYSQAMPLTIVELLEAKELINKFRNNDFSLFDSRDFFYANGKMKIEFRHAEISTDLAEKMIFYDNVELTQAGIELREGLKNLMKERVIEGKDLSLSDVSLDLMTPELEAFSYHLNNLVAVMAFNEGIPFENVRDNLAEQIEQMKSKFPENEFLSYIVVNKPKFGPDISILQEFKNSVISDAQMDKIHEDFDKLPQAFKKQLVSYQFHRYGTSSSRRNGGYYQLVSNEFKKFVGRKVNAEIQKFDSPEYSLRTKAMMLNYIINTSELRRLKELWPEGKTQRARNYDIYKAVNANLPITDTALQELALIKEIDDYKAWLSKYNIKQFKERFGAITEKPSPTLRDLIPWAAQEALLFNQRLGDIGYSIDPDPDAVSEDVKNMLATDQVGEALASEDPALTKFVLDKLKQKYPDVIFFTSREDFYAFVTRNHGSLRDVTMTEVGHAFRNAVFVDPDTALQSTAVHEYAHIYWDALPTDHPAKVALVNHFRTNPAFKDSENVEEDIITAIGKAGYGMAETEFQGTFLDKFVRLLQDFWRAVRNAFGKYSQADLVNDMAKEVWENKESINAQTVAGQVAVRSMALPGDPDLQVQYFEENHTYMMGEDVIPSVTEVITNLQTEGFDPDVKASHVANAFERNYKEMTQGQRMSHEIWQAEYDAVKQAWDAKRETGSIIHAVAEEIFGGKELSQDAEKSFKDQTILRSLRESLMNLKRAILVKYPQATFESEVMVSSNKYKMAGTVDLKVNIGDKKIIVIDFKTADAPYIDSEGKMTLGYTKEYSPMKPPYTEGQKLSKKLKHQSQVGLYAGLAEEKGEEVTAVYVAPIVRRVDKEGKITSAGLAGAVAIETEDGLVPDPWANMVDFKWRNKDGSHRKIYHKLIQDILEYNRLRMVPLNKASQEYKNALIQGGIMPRLANTMIAADSFFKRLSPELKNLKPVHLEPVFNIGLTNIVMGLSDLGYETADITGKDAYPMEMLFYAAARGITKQEMTDNFEKHFPERIVDSSWKKVKNKEKKTTQSFYHLKLDGEDVYLREAGHNTLEAGDRIVEIYDIELSSGEVRREHYYHKVIEVDTRYNNVIVEDEQSGDLRRIESPSENSGIIKVLDGPVKNVKTEEGYFEPEYTTERVEEKENHFEGTVPEVYGFFNRYNTIGKLREFLSNKEAVEILYEKLRYLEDQASSDLHKLLYETLTTHYFTEGIIEEDLLDKNSMRPITLNAFLMITNNKDSLEGTFRNKGLAKFFSNARMMNGRYIQLHTVTSGIEHAYKQAHLAQMSLRKKLNVLADKITHENIVEEVYGEFYYKRPDALGLTQEEQKFLDEIYKYHYKYNPKYSQRTRTPGTYPFRIRRASIYALKGEMREKYGKWGNTLHRLLRAAEYDNVEIEIVEKTAYGGYKGTGKYTTLKEIKEAFAFEKGSTEQTKKWLGKRWKHKLAFWHPLRVLLRNRNGTLNYYTMKAMKAYNMTAKGKTIESKISRSRIPTVGQGKALYETEFRNEAELKSIESLIFSHFMKSMVGPLDYMRYTYGKDSDISLWMNKYANAIMFKELPESSFMNNQASKEFMDFIMQLNSMSKISMQFRVQLNNLAIGMGTNLVREPAIFFKGLKNLLASGPEQFIKVINLAKRIGLVSAADTPYFDTIEKTLHAGMGARAKKWWEWLIEKGYKPMEVAEKMIQIPLLAGMMTKAELSAYNRKGEPISATKRMGRRRIRIITDRIKSIHGDYGPVNASPDWLVPDLGHSGLFQFRKWIPAMGHRMVAQYHLDRNYEMKAGLWRTLGLLRRILVYNTSGGQKRADRYNDILKKYEDPAKPMDKIFIASTKEYLEFLIDEKQGRKISLKKDLKAVDKENLLSFVLQLSTYTLLLMARLWVKDEKENNPDWNTKVWKQIFGNYVYRYMGDLFALYSYDSNKRLIEDPVPALSIVKNLALFNVQFIGWLAGFIPGSDIDWIPKDERARLKEKNNKNFVSPMTIDLHSGWMTYPKDEKYASAGTPKWMVTGTHLVPMGSTMRLISEMYHNLKDRFDKTDLIEMGMDPEDIDFIEDGELSKFRIEQNAKAYDQYMKIIRDGVTAQGVEKILTEQKKEQGVKGEIDIDKSDINEFKALQTIVDDTEDKYKKVQKAVAWEMLNEKAMNDEELATQMEVVEKYSKEERKREAAEGPQTRRRKKKLFRRFEEENPELFEELDTDKLNL
jgi:hypothetical protein